MGKFESASTIGLRNKETNKLIAVYPFKAEGSDEEITKKVRDWYYMQNCSAEEELRKAYVDILTDAEAKSIK
ncbi:hypothetical protein [Lacrimispora sp.]|uniref:hypothetical protein n=1 Tax=Lacrimispora sp. TaxID=2719234 RepID=UPI0028970213|nr:hypothetical protein [Lacrimispora sp.]